jgi:hypothetical protein
MNRAVLGKRAAVTFVTAGFALTLGAPAFADAQAGTQPAQMPSFANQASVQAPGFADDQAGVQASPRDSGHAVFTLDFTNTTWAPSDSAGAAVVGTGIVADQGNNVVGTIDDSCAVVRVTAGGIDQAQCTSQIRFNNGDELDFNSYTPISETPVSVPFTGVVTGGSGNLDGARGEVLLTNTAPAVYTADFDVR